MGVGNWSLHAFHDTSGLLAAFQIAALQYSPMSSSCCMIARLSAVQNSTARRTLLFVCVTIEFVLGEITSYTYAM